MGPVPFFITGNGSLIGEIRKLHSQMQQMNSGLEAFQIELMERQRANSLEINQSISALTVDVKNLSGTLSSIQSHLSDVGRALGTLTRIAEQNDFNRTITTHRPPMTTSTTTPLSLMSTYGYDENTNISVGKCFFLYQLPHILTALLHGDLINVTYLIACIFIRSTYRCTF